MWKKLLEWFSPERPDEDAVRQDIHRVDQKMSDVEASLKALRIRLEVMTRR